MCCWGRRARVPTISSGKNPEFTRTRPCAGEGRMHARLWDCANSSLLPEKIVTWAIRRTQEDGEVISSCRECARIV